MARKIALGLLGIFFLVAVAAVLAIRLMDPATLLKWSMDRERSKAGLSESAVQIDDHTMAYVEGGSGPNLILLHGYNAEKDHWTRMAQHLTKPVHLVAPDLPGAGNSSRLQDASYDYRSQVTRLKRFVDERGLAPMFLGGNSMGGHISALYAATYPSDVKGLILFNAAGVTSPIPSELQREREKGRNPLVARNAEEFEALMNFVFEKPPWLPDNIKTHFAEKSIANTAFAEKIWADLMRQPVKLEEMLPHIQIPTLIIWGEFDRVIHPSAADVFHRLLPQSKLVMMEGIGHAPMLEDPAESAALVEEFIAQHHR